MPCELQCPNRNPRASNITFRSFVYLCSREQQKRIYIVVVRELCTQPSVFNCEYCESCVIPTTYWIRITRNASKTTAGFRLTEQRSPKFDHRITFCTNTHDQIRVSARSPRHYRQQQQIQPMQIMSHFAAIRITPSNVVVSQQPVAPHRVPTALPGFGCVRNLCDLYAHLTRRQTDTEKHKICAGFYMDRLTQIYIHTSITLHDTKRKTCAQIELMFCDQIIYHIKQSVCVCCPFVLRYAHCDSAI